MEIELHPTVSLLPETNSILVAPAEMLAGTLNSHLELQRYKILFICGNYSRILSRLNRNNTSLEVRRAFTVFQLMTILEEKDPSRWGYSNLHISSRAQIFCEPEQAFAGYWRN